MVSYPNENEWERLRRLQLRLERDVQRNYREAAEIERDTALAEAAKWRNAHRSVVVSKRRLSAKYGAIMRRRPKALWRRLRKWIGGRR